MLLAHRFTAWTSPVSDTLRGLTPRSVMPLPMALTRRVQKPSLAKIATVSLQQIAYNGDRNVVVLENLVT